MWDDELEARIRSEAERAGPDAEAYIREVLPRELQGAKRLPMDEWIALLHQAPPVAAHAREIPHEALRRGSLYEDRA